MSEKQFRSWLRNKLSAAGARPDYMKPNGTDFRFTKDQLIDDLKRIVEQAEQFAKKPIR